MRPALDLPLDFGPSADEADRASGPTPRLEDPTVEAWFEPPTFEAVYDSELDFVYRTLRRLGVDDRQVDDALQDVFLVIHRRLGDFQGKSALRTWTFGIVLRVAKDYRRRFRRKGIADGARVDPDSVACDESPDPHEQARAAEGVRALHRLLDELDDDKRAVFVLAELEQMSMPEIAATLGVNPNTASARLRAARAAFEQAVARHHARDQWRMT